MEKEIKWNDKNSQSKRKCKWREKTKTLVGQVENK